MNEYMKKYGWEIADQVQRHVDNASETEFVPFSAHKKLIDKLEQAERERDNLCGHVESFRKRNVELASHLAATEAERDSNLDQLKWSLKNEEKLKQRCAELEAERLHWSDPKHWERK